MTDVKLTDKQYRDAIDWVVMVQRGRFPIERGHIDAIAAILLSPKQQAAEEMAKVLERFNQYYESDFIRVSADDGRTLADQMHSMRVAVDAYNALAKAGQQ